MSKQRYVMLAFIIGSILVGLTLQSAIVSAFAQFAWPDNRLGGVLNTSTSLSILGAGLTFFILIRTKRALNFSSEVVGELVRVTWPSRDETVRASTTVVLTTLLTAALLAFYDYTWKQLADLFLFGNG
ncbi:MAG TPA: preprotein translocase subunit SecE [Deltaproteobacteria bacterium]|nr:preprotein translocase subunit SecE [Deltaproteobacteria bacterium]